MIWYSKAFSAEGRTRIGACSLDLNRHDIPLIMLATSLEALVSDALQLRGKRWVRMIEFDGQKVSCSSVPLRHIVAYDCRTRNVALDCAASAIC